MSTRGLNAGLVVLLYVVTAGPSAAEVADKIPSLRLLWAEGILLGVVFFLAARFRLWLGIALLPLSAFMIWESLDFLVWSHVGQSARQELGANYPVAVVGSASLHALGHVAGLINSLARHWRPLALPPLPLSQKLT